MARNLSPKCKLCRREGVKLFLKGERCYSPKCAFIKRKYPPGTHGPKGYPKLSEYGRQLREKQKIKKIYGILEKQLRIYATRAAKFVGNDEEILLRLLELRLDNVIYRATFVSSRSMARQVVNHGHLKINGRRVNIPSYQVEPGDEIVIKEGSKIFKKIKQNIEANKGKIKPSSWLEVDSNKLAIKVINKPLVGDLIQDVNAKLIIEFYSR
ncbi:MAG: 30S ribosomal protein S4 [Ignavibacterium sp.]|nr:30S ribosomal protein S4 [Ignavibacterium sp.]